MTLFKEETLQHKLIFKGATLVILSFLIAPAGYIIRAIISNDLSVEEVGIFYSILGLISILLAYSWLGLNESFKYFFPRFWIQDQRQKGKVLLVLFFLSQILMAIVFAALMWWGSSWLAQHYFRFPQAQDTIKLFAIFLIVVRSLNVLTYFFETIQEVFWSKFFEFVRMWVSVVGVIYVWQRWFGSLFDYSFWRVIGGVVALLWAVLVFKLKYRKYFEGVTYPSLVQTTDLFKKVFKYGLYSLAAVQGSVFLGSIDQQVVVYFLGSKAAGYYTTFLSILFLFTIVTGPLFSFLFPLTSELISKKQTDRLKLLLSLLYKYFTIFGIFVGLFYFLMGKTIIFSLFGEKYLPAAHLLKIASLFVLVNIIISINFSILSWLGKVRERAIIIWRVALWNVVSDLIFVYLWWLRGVVYSTLVGWFIFLIWTYTLVSKELKRTFRPDWSFFGVNFLGLFLRAILVQKICDWISCESFWRLMSFEYIVLVGLSWVIVLGLINFKGLIHLKNLILTNKKWN